MTSTPPHEEMMLPESRAELERGLRFAHVMISVNQDQGNEAVALLKRQAGGKETNLAAIAALLEELGHTSAAEEMYRKLVDQSTDSQSVLVLAAYLGRQKRFREALEL